MKDKLLLRAVENEEAFGAKGKSKPPMNLFRERHGLPVTTPEAIEKKRKALLRLSQMKNRRGWIGK